MADSKEQSIGEKVGGAISGWFTKPSKWPTTGDILSGLILTSTKTRNKGIGGYRFTQMRDDEIEISSNITDYVIESGMTIQDAIQLKPLRMKLTGLAAEVSYGESKQLTAVDALVSNLKPITNLLPSMDDKTAALYMQLNKYYGEYEKLRNQVNDILGIWADNHDENVTGSESLANWFKNLTGTKQQRAFAQLYSCWKAREMMSIETPFGVQENMVIESVSFKQTSRSNTYAEIEVTLKQLTFAKTQTTGNGDNNTDAGRRNGQTNINDTGITGSGSITDKKLENSYYTPIEGENYSEERYRTEAG